MSCHVPEEVTTSVSERTVCLVGMPNCGKTTLMNALTGGNFRTANYPGVTVSLLRGKSKPELGPPVSIVDLPGVHSPIAPSPEEELACSVIEGTHARVKPDAFVLVVDATQLERHLKFAGFVVRQGKPVVIAMTMMDLLPRTHQSIDTSKLAEALGVTIVPVDGRTAAGMKELLSTLNREAREAHRASVNALASLPTEPVAAYDALRLLLKNSGAIHRIDQISPMSGSADSLTGRIDRIVLNRFWGFPIFFAILILLFAAIFWAAQPFMDMIGAAFTFAGEGIAKLLGMSMIGRFLGEGIVEGVGVVAVFFPQIMILFFLMTLLEDSGYLARGAALVDRPLAYLGLHGRSFVPMLSGFACAIPAIFAARAIPSRRERLLTIWIIPLMSCSARLPVYALLLAALLPAAAWKAGVSLAAIYIGSLVIGALVAGLASRLVFKYREPSMLAMELPAAYRVPRWKPILRTTWARGSTYLQRAGVSIITVSAILWLISNLGFSSKSFVAQVGRESSIAAQLGHKMESALHPMGVDWRVGVGLISAFAAREVFVSSMAIVFHVNGDEASQQKDLLEQMRTATFAGTNQRIFTASSIIGLIVFFFFSLQCFSTVAIVRKETGSWKVAGLQLAFYTGLGYILAVAAVQTLRAAGVA